MQIENQDEMDGFALALAFDTDSADFVRGVEVGRIWEMLKQTDAPLGEMVHVSNAEMVIRMAEATGRNVRSEELDDRWLWIIFGAT